MDAQIKEKWVTALRSDKYFQGKYRLNKNHKEYCCLGVLCDIYRQETGLGEWANTSEHGSVVGDYEQRVKIFVTELSTESEFIPGMVSDWAGLVRSEALELARLNDGVDKQIPSSSFTEIAAWIENQL